MASYLRCRENPSNALLSQTRCRKQIQKHQSPWRQKYLPPGVSQHSWVWIRHWSYVYQARQKDHQGCCLEAELCSTHRSYSGRSGSGHTLQFLIPLPDEVLVPSMVLLPPIVPWSPGSGSSQSLAAGPAESYWRCHTELPTIPIAAWLGMQVRYVQGAHDKAPTTSGTASQHIGTVITLQPCGPQR